MKLHVKHSLPPVRKFERGASGTGLDQLLNQAGYAVTAVGGMYAVKIAGAPGRAKKMSRKKFMALVDKIRVERGLEPIVKRG